MYLEDSIMTNQDAENMFGAYMKKVIVRSSKRFDSIIRDRCEHEEFTLNTATPGFAEENIEQLEDKTFTIEENIAIDRHHLETAFTDANMYKAVKGLSSKQKHILFFIYFKDVSEQQIADILGLAR